MDKADTLHGRRKGHKEEVEEEKRGIRGKHSYSYSSGKLGLGHRSLGPDAFLTQLGDQAPLRLTLQWEAEITVQLTPPATCQSWARRLLLNRLCEHLGE